METSWIKEEIVKLKVHQHMIRNDVFREKVSEVIKAYLELLKTCQMINAESEIENRYREATGK